MDTLAPSTIVVAMEQLDSELAVLSQRRQLLQQLLATWDDADGETVTTAWVRVEREPEPPEQANERFAIVDAAPPATETPARRGGRQKKWDYLEVAQVITDGVEAGKTATGSLVDHYGVNKGMAGFLMKRCRELGYTRDERTPFVSTPIERTSFDAEAARDRAAVASAPKDGRGGGTPSWQPTPRPVRPMAAEAPAPKFSVDDAVAALEAS
jgi:hypothetical protein